MKNQPGDKVFSIILPVFNAATTIQDTLESIFNQTFKRFELIIINDGSTDDSLNKINDFIKVKHVKNSQIKIFNQNNQGVANARNNGINKANANYIAFIDADDLWHPKKLYEAYKYINKLKPDILYSDYTIIDQNNFVLGSVKCPDFLNYEKMLCQNFIALSSSIISINFLNDIRFKSIGHEDYKFWLDLMSSNKKQIKCLKLISKETLLFYRQSQNSISANKINAIKWHFNIIKSQNIRLDYKFFYFLNYLFKNIIKYLKIHCVKLINRKSNVTKISVKDFT